MLTIGHQKETGRHYLRLIENHYFNSDFRNTAFIYNNLGLIYSHLNQRIKANGYLQKSILNIYLKQIYY